MVKFSPIALNFGYAFVLLVHFFGKPCMTEISVFRVNIGNTESSCSPANAVYLRSVVVLQCKMHKKDKKSINKPWKSSDCVPSHTDYSRWPFGIGSFGNICIFGLKHPHVSMRRISLSCAIVHLCIAKSTTDPRAECFCQSNSYYKSYHIVKFVHQSWSEFNHPILE